MYERLYDVWLFRGKVVNPSPKESSPGRRGPRKQTPPKNLLDRLERYKQETLVFLSDFRVPFDNSLAERRVTTQRFADCYATWSPDGRCLAYAAQSLTDFEIVSWDAVTGDTVALTDTGRDEAFPAWSPDGMWLSRSPEVRRHPRFRRSPRQGTPGTA